MTLAELARALGGTVEGDPGVPLRGVAGLEDAAPGLLVRVEHPRFLAAALATPAAALLVGPDIDPGDRPAIRVAEVKQAFIRCLELFAPPEWRPAGIHPSAVLGEAVVLGEGCSIGACAVLGNGVRLAAG